MVAAKQKGSAAERELLDILWENSFGVLRVAGSGSTQHDACDLIAGKNGKSYAIEVKACINGKQYISSDQMSELKTFSQAFGAIPLIAVKWTRKGWSVCPAEQVKATGKLYGVSQNEMQPLESWLKQQ